jgi:Flp pilus assembly protein TadB
MGEGCNRRASQSGRMKPNMLLGAVFLGVGLLLVVVGGWFGLLVGIVALLMGLVLVVRGYRLRSARA